MNNKMTFTRSKQSHLGSAQWAQDERQAMDQAVSNELEDFYYSAYNEFDWLNEKMEEVLARMQATAKKHSSRKNSPQRVGKPGNTDSGYHGLTEDEMESHRNTQHTADEREEAQNIASHEDVEQSTDQSFSSARENVMIAQKAAQQQLQNEMAAERELVAKNTAEPEQMPQQLETAMAPDEHMEDATIEDVFETDRPLQRKSSFNFSSLPAREPLLSKKSVVLGQVNMKGFQDQQARSFLDKQAVVKMLRLLMLLRPRHNVYMRESRCLARLERQCFPKSLLLLLHILNYLDISQHRILINKQEIELLTTDQTKQ
ncbi:hypothetical protein MRB53_041170 [Persea americana]|nr:hypothetical protein MRB53_041170 [Persea americana]